MLEISHSTKHEPETYSEASSPNILVNFSPHDQYIFQVVQNMVDDVCLYHARVDQAKKKYIGQINDLENSADLEEK